MEIRGESWKCTTVAKFLAIYCAAVVINSVLTSSVPPKFDSTSVTQQARYSEGKEQMGKLHAMSQLPRIGQCWKSALEGMVVSCKELDEDTQARLALRFTSCFNQMTKFSPYICEDNNPLDQCLQALDSNAMNTFRDFFLQTQNMCFYLQSEIWREATDRSVNELTNTASLVSKNLKDTEETQKRILESQEQSEKLQAGLMKDQNTLFNVVVRFKDIFDDFRVSVEDHRLIFAEIFEKLTRTQKLVSWIQGEMSLLDMMGFYFISLIFGFIATSTQRTKQARFWLVCLAIASLATERYAFGYFNVSDKTPEQVQEIVWFIRRFAAAVGVIFLIWAAASYRDYQALNNNMLAELHSRVEILVEFVNELSKSGIHIPPQLKIKGNEEPEGKELEADEEASDISSNLTFSDYTNDSDISRIEDMSNESLPVRDEINTNSTPPGRKSVPLFERWFGSRRSENEENMESSNQLDTPSSVPEAHRYNLRQRKTPLRENSILHTEGPTMFANVVKKGRKRNQPKSEVSKQLSYFSSDDEF